jgi:membrane protein DedA with SNARE-associated domain
MRKYFKLASAITIFVGGMFLLSYIDVAPLLASVGDTYLLLFLFVFGVLAGSSTFTSSTYLATVAYLGGQGTIDPLTLGFVCGTGFFLGDTIYYLFGRVIETLSNEVIGKNAKRLMKIIDSKPLWARNLIIFIYTGLTPFPGDLLMLSLALLRYRYLSFMLPLLLGNIVLLYLAAKVGYLVL